MAAQSASPPTENWFKQLPFEQWVKEGPSQQFPFKGHSQVLGLSVQQRLVAEVELRIDGAILVPRGTQGKVVALVQMTDRDGKDYRDTGELALDTLKSGARGTEVSISWMVFVRPGDYEITIAIYHTQTKEHGLLRRSLHVPEWKNSFQSSMWSKLPNAEFWGTPTDTDAYYLPDIDHDVHVPLRSSRPISLEIIADVTASDAFAGSTELFNQYLYKMLPAMRVLTNADVTNGSIRVSAVDLLHRQEVFDQRNVHALDWERFRKVFSSGNTGTVDVASLNKHKSPVFLRQEIARRLPTNDGDNKQPFRVFIVLTAPLGSYSFGGLEEEGALPEKCDCRVYYLEFEVVRERVTTFGRRRVQIPYSALSAKHDVEKLLRPLPVKSFEIDALRPAESMGNALRKISQEISEF